MFINVYRENLECDFEVVRAVAAAIIGQLDTLSPYILLVIYIYLVLILLVFLWCLEMFFEQGTYMCFVGLW